MPVYLDFEPTISQRDQWTYRTTDWTYDMSIATQPDAPPDEATWMNPSFIPGDQWSQGSGWRVGFSTIQMAGGATSSYQPFGTANEWTDPDVTPVRTNWARAKILYVRKKITFDTPAASLIIQPKIDNYTWCYWDGDYIGATRYTGTGFPTTFNLTPVSSWTSTTPAHLTATEHTLAYCALNEGGGAGGPNVVAYKISTT